MFYDLGGAVEVILEFFFISTLAIQDASLQPAANAFALSLHSCRVTFWEGTGAKRDGIDDS